MGDERGRRRRPDDDDGPDDAPGDPGGAGADGSGTGRSPLGPDDLAAAGLAFAAGVLAFAAPRLVLVGAGATLAEAAGLRAAGPPSFSSAFDLVLPAVAKVAQEAGLALPWTLELFMGLRPDLVGLGVGVLGAGGVLGAAAAGAPPAARLAARIAGLALPAFALGASLLAATHFVAVVDAGRLLGGPGPPHPGRAAAVADEVLGAVRRGLGRAGAFTTPGGVRLSFFPYEGPGVTDRAPPGELAYEVARGREGVVVLPWGGEGNTDPGRELWLTYPCGPREAFAPAAIDRGQRPASPFDVEAFALTRDGRRVPRVRAVHAAGEEGGVRYGYALTFSRTRAAPAADGAPAPAFADGVYRVLVHVFADFDPAGAGGEDVPDGNVPVRELVSLVNVRLVRP